MSIKEKIQRKLEPHTQRIAQGTNDEFDYLPATLFELIQQQETASAECKSGISSLSQKIESTADLFINKLDDAHQKTNNSISELIQQQEVAATQLKTAIGALSNEVKMVNDLVIQKFDESNKKLMRVNFVMLFLLTVIAGLLIFIVSKH